MNFPMNLLRHKFVSEHLFLQVSRLVKIPGIVVSASGIKSKATRISLQCRTCRNVIPNISIKPGLEGYALPRKCNTEQVIINLVSN